MVLKGTQQTFSAAFGTTRTGRTVTVTILDAAGSVVGSGYSAGSVVELGGGVYGVAITFSVAMVGFIKWNDVTDNLIVFEPILVTENYLTDVALIKKMEFNRWKITNNQLVIYDDDDTTPIYTFDLKKAGVANGSEPDERIPA